VTEDEALTALFASSFGRGPGRVAGTLPTESQETTFRRAEDLPHVVPLLERALADLGGTWSRQDVSPEEVWVSGTLGSGFLNLDPTLLAAVVRSRPGGGAVITVRASAKEGLVKQHSARKALDRLGRALGG
jgi:hypothetical protein